MKKQELSDLAVAHGKTKARGAFRKYGTTGPRPTVTLTEDRLTALLARAFEAGHKAKR